MFSFFKSKKPSSDSSPADPIPGPIPPAPKEDDFIFVERKAPGTPSANGSPSHGIYPSIPPSAATDAAGGSPAVRQQSEEKTSHILHGVPFKLSPGLTKDSNFEITQYQLNEIFAFIGQVANAQLDYDFSLERSVLNDR
ncbi:uncharacterized protein LOC131680799 [Topomyia yanbarensis]|uniref:uncharacterized protein LOC131680799 n=1 Tax=Topomyia yanbarensis TaxID=2498891 RepID=UPI00273A7E20|nr:uncharacterized protein LOC131680799 [Topomyia yanbarensis]